jgi:hypothetical protein
MAQDLLTNVYEEYRRYSERSKKAQRIVDPNAVIVNNMIQVKKTEIVTGRKTAPQNTFVSNPQTAPTHNSNSYGGQITPAG